MFRRLVSLSGAALLLSGCALGPQLTNVAVDHNQMVAAIEDKLTLLNIVRASERFPLHFTAVTETSGGATVSLNADIASALVPGPNSYSSRSASGISSSPNFKSAVLATDSFQRGIQKPLAPELAAYFLDEGWRDAVIMALFIERVDVLDTGSDFALVRSIENDPANSSEFADLMCSFHMTSVTSAKARPLARVDQLLTLVSNDAGSQTAASSAASSAERYAEIKEFMALMENDSLEVNGDQIYLKNRPSTVALRALPQSRCGDRVAANASVLPTDLPDRYMLAPRFRSTLGIIYFLGEYVRAEQSGGGNKPYRLPYCLNNCRTPNKDTTYSFRPLIDVRIGSGDALVDAEFQGVRYYVSSDESEARNAETSPRARSMQIIAIVEQLVNLNKSANDLPRSISVFGGN